MENAGGSVWTPIIILNKISVGSAEAEEVEAIINSKLKGLDGLLGMSFLNQFRVDKKYFEARMVLKPLHTAGERFYGSKPEGWWKERLKTYYRGILQSQNLARQLRQKGNPKTYNVGLTEKHYRGLYRRLVKRVLRVGASMIPRPEP